MLSKIAIASLLLGSALAAPYPPQIAENPHKTIPEVAKFRPKAPGGGNFMPSDASRAAASRTSPAAPEAAVDVQRRSTNERVSNGAIARFDNTNIQDGTGSGSDSYTMYWGDGSTGQGWPSKDRWVSFENMFNNYKPQMFSSCDWMGVPNNSGPEVGAIWDGIQAAAAATGVDHRFILAVIMQESGGCVRVHTTNYGVRNPGLMQDHNGSATCNENGVQNPCPSSTIAKMISEGTAGTNDGDGLANCINQSGRGDVSAFYRGARIYNSGSISHTGLLQDGIATHCYASDIANRLTGWINAPHGCQCDNSGNPCHVQTS
ncbi:hypothetical protein PT974_07901 [Cladobotryum mycophilum]|uniref:Glycoside hydrolase n=1 Tax=Cladobotryum mycophilum TaxID=491253 RepID=A0ABR0SDB7_9HYPO